MKSVLLILVVSTCVVALISACLLQIGLVPYGIVESSLVIGVAVVVAFEEVTASLLRGFDDMAYAGLAQGTIRRFGMLTVLAIFALGLYEPVGILEAVAIWIACGAINVLIAAIRVLENIRDVEVSRDRTVSGVGGMNAKEVLRVSLPMGVTNVGRMVRGSSDILIIGALIGSEAAGIFGPLKKISHGAKFVIGPATQALAPRIPVLASDGDWSKVEQLCGRVALISSAFSGLALVAVILIGEPVVEWLYSNAHSEYIGVLVILIAGQLARSVGGAPEAVLEMTGKERTVTRTSLWIATLAVLLLVVGALVGSLLAVAAVASSVLALYVVALAFIVYTEYGVKTYLRADLFKSV